MKLGVVMDPIQTILFHHDSTLAMLWEAQDRGWPLFYFESQDLFLREGKAYGMAKPLTVYRDPKRWFSFEASLEVALGDLDLILMRKDPPFNEEYLYLTHILERAEREGAMVVNRPQALRDWNEKLVITAFPQCCVPTLVSSKIALLTAFWQKEKEIVCKPLHAMGGFSVYHLRPQDPNATVIFESLTGQEKRHVMVQRFIPEIIAGDKRIVLINGEPLPFAIARVPQANEWRGNIGVGAKPIAQPLSPRDRWLCQELTPFLQEQGIYFAGIDVIGDYLTEINITSPTCIRELDEQCGLNISAQFLDSLEKLRNS